MTAKIPLPPLTIQEQIVSELDNYQKIIDGARQVVDNYKPNIRIDFSWELKPLGQICDVRDGTHDSPKFVQDGFPLVTSKNIKNGTIILDDVNFISKEDYDKINQRSKVDKGDILMPMIGTIGKQFLSYVLTLRSKIQDEILSICFSENGFNETLWLKYADTHKGFCLMYDLSDADSSHCGKLDKCVNCGVYKYGTRIYPVYYSNTPHDATNFAKFVMGQDMMQQLHVPLPDFMQEELKPLPWEVERNSLIKKECHKYDEEWRMLANCKMNLPAMIEYVPAGVIIGLRTPPVDKNLIISMAKEAGVKNIYQSYIDEKNRLNAYLLKDV